MFDNRKYKTINEIETLIDKYNNSKLYFENLQNEIAFLYNIGSFYSEYYQLQNLSKVIFRKEDEYYLPIYYYLKAIKLYEDNKNTIDKDINFIQETIIRLYVNIGNEFSNQFRTINALLYFRKALEIDNNFNMAVGNFALCIEHHSPLVGLAKDKYSLVFNLIYELYDMVDIANIESGEQLFLSKKVKYKNKQEDYIRAMFWGKDTNYDPYAFFTETYCNSDDFEYWCVKNILYLNYINDLGVYEEAKFDISLFEMNDELKLSESQLYIINQLFEMFSFQRKKLYECKKLNSNEVFIELTLIFQSLYSYFDKVAFFIYKYFNLKGKERDVNINSIWLMNDVDGNSLLKYENQYLYNIFWLRKEYREKPKSDKGDININELLSPDAQDYSFIRNTIEHKQFSFREIKGLFYLNPNLLYDKTLKLAGVIRNMLLSLVQLIRTETKLIDPKTNKRDFDLVYLEFQGFV